jgi:hypothetical protein
MNLYITCRLISFFHPAAPWLRKSISAISLHRPKFDSRPVHVRTVTDKVTLGQVVFPLSTSAFPCQYHFTNAPYSVFIYMLLVLKDRQVKPGNLPKSNALSEIGKCWIQQHFHFFIFFKGLQTSSANYTLHPGTSTTLMCVSSSKMLLLKIPNVQLTNRYDSKAIHPSSYLHIPSP